MDWLAWFRIVAYRDVHDVPRHVLATNDAGDQFWILDAGIDDASDASIYTIHDAGRDLDAATALFEQDAGASTALAAFGCIPVAHVQFDETRRGALKLTSPPIT